MCRVVCDFVLQAQPQQFDAGDRNQGASNYSNDPQCSPRPVPLLHSRLGKGEEFRALLVSEGVGFSEFKVSGWVRGT